MLRVLLSAGCILHLSDLQMVSPVGWPKVAITSFLAGGTCGGGAEKL